MKVANNLLKKKKYKYHIGIDPGIDGAITVSSNDVIVEIFKMPIDYFCTGKLSLRRDGLRNNKKKVSYDGLRIILKIIMSKYSVSETKINIEMIRGGVVSPKLMANANYILGAFHIFGYEINEISPVKWKSIYGIMGKDKKQSIAVFERIFCTKRYSFQLLVEKKLNRESLRLAGKKIKEDLKKRKSIRIFEGYELPIAIKNDDNIADSALMSIL